ncbi:MAG: outer membrane protein OmpA-like peptidoglycan-associated protein, partial [Marivirga sp.]
ELDRMLQVMKENTGIKVSIIGHTDNIGTEPYNLTLSENRAKAVVDYLIANGIAKARLSFEGQGELYPAVPNTNPTTRAQNRRVNFKVD